MKHRMSIFVTLLSLVALLVVPLSFVVSAEGNDATESGEQQNHQSQLQLKDEMIVMGEEEESEHHQTLSHEQIAQVTDQFMDQLVQDTDENYNVEQFDTLEELKASFSDFAAEDVVNEFVDVFYEIRDGELKIVPTSTPPWFVVDEEYEVEQTDNDSYLITQETGNELHGNYTVQFEIQLNEDNEPFIMDVNYPQ